MGLRTVDSSCAGLGGCPYAPGATGNVATEDVVYMLRNGRNFKVRADLLKLLEAGEFITSLLGIEPRSRVAKAMKSQKRFDKH